MLLCLLVLLCSSSAAVALPGRPSANSTSTPYLNTTAISISSRAPDPTPASDSWPRPVSTGPSMQVLPTTVSPTPLTTPAYAYPNNNHTPTTDLPIAGASNSTSNETLSVTRASLNSTCTVQIPHASVGWWYPAIFNHKLGTFTTSANNFSRHDSVTLLTSTATFDVSSAVESDSVCTMSETYFAEWDATITQCEDYTSKPTAAATSVAYRKAASVPLPSDNVVPMSDLWMYDLWGLELPSATTTISAAPNVTITETSATPFVHFTAYEVAYNNRTETVQLPSAHVYPYWFNWTEDSTSVSGRIPGEFLQQIPHLDCDVGQLQATVTVVIVVDLYYENRPNFDPFIVHFESTVLGWENDTPFVVLDQSSRPPTVVTDWEIPDPNQPTPPARPQLRPDSGPTTRDGRVQAHGAPQTAGAIGSEPIVLGPSGVVVGSQTLRPGSAITVAGTPVAMVPSPTALVIGGTTTLLPKPVDPAVGQIVGTIGTHPIVVGPSSVIVVGSQTIRPGAPITVDVGGGVPVSFASEATALVVGGVTTLLPAPGHISPAPPMLTIGSSIFTPDTATQYILNPGQTLTPGGVAVLDGTRISLEPAASFVVIGDSTQGLSPSVTVPQMIVGSMTFTPLTPGPIGAPTPIARFLIDGQTLIAGGPPVTISTPHDPTISTPPTTLSLAPSATMLLVNGVPTPLTPPPPPPPATPPVLTLGTATTLTPAPGPLTRYLVGDQTLTPGGAVTVAGTTVELADGASAVRWGVQGAWETGVVGSEGEGGGEGRVGGGRASASLSVSPTGLGPSSAAGRWGCRRGVWAVVAVLFAGSVVV